MRINSGAGDDSITNCGDSVTIDGGDGYDVIYSDVGGSTESGTNINIFGGKGNDFIGSDTPYSTINGGADDDTIYNYGWNVSIDGGADVFHVNNVAYQISGKKLVPNP